MIVYRLYCLKDSSGNIVYVGNTTRSLSVRFLEHIKRKKLNPDEYSIHLLGESFTKELASLLEENYIKRFDLVKKGLNQTYGYGRQGIGPNKTSFKPGNSYGKMGTKRVRCIETNQEFDSLTKCAKAMNLDVRKISDVCNGRRKTHGGFRFEFI